MTANVEDAVTAAERFALWIERFETALNDRDSVRTAVDLFADDSYWMDFLAMTWRYRTFNGPAEIQRLLSATSDQIELSGFEVSPNRIPPRIARRSGIDVLEGFFDFTTKFGNGTAYLRVRLGNESRDDEIWILSTTLQSLHGAEPQVGRNRPRGYGDGDTKHIYDKLAAPIDQDGQVLIVGGGQGGLILGARLRQVGIDPLIVEKHDRIGDNWRKRYESLVLHNEIPTNTLPYMPFPQTWPSFLPKDKVAQWLETYSEAMGLRVWTGTEVVGVERDEGTKQWHVAMRRKDGTEVTQTVAHVVMATGGHSGVPNIPNIPGIAEFNGDVIHSSQYSSSEQYVGKRAVVFGTGSSAHDIAQDLFERGAASVTMIQRNPSAVISLDPCGTMVYAAYTDEATSEDVDLVQAATPYPVLKETYQWLTKKTCEMDRDLLEGLERAGFRTDFEPDNTGFHMKYLRKGGGYYINVGASDLIVEGKVAVEQAANVDTVTASGVALHDGRILEADLIVLATGYKNQQEAVRLLLGDEIAEQVGPIWGFDENYVMRNMWTKTAQDGFWVMGGALQEARLYSTYLALQIKADLDGLLPKEPLA